jgi:hypothetical protein
VTAKFLSSDIRLFRNPDNPALEESSPKTGSFVLYQKKSFINVTGTSQGHV